MAADYFTFDDALGHLLDYERAPAGSPRVRIHHRAVFSALRVIAQAHKWSYLTNVGRVNTVAPQTSGTIQYDHSGSTNEREVTLSDATWPSWAFAGTLLVGEVRYTVARRIDDTTLTLSIASNPGEDIASGTSYTLFRDRYQLPEDFWTIDDLQTPESWRVLTWVHPRDWMRITRHNTSSANTPQYYSVIGSETYQGAMDLILEPYPDSATNIDFIYSRRPRAVSVQDEKAGTVTTTADSTTVTGDGTNFTDAMVGSLIRVADDDQEYPTGSEGANPYAEQRVVMAVSSTTSLEVDIAFETTRSDGVKYVVSDPIDIEYGVMQEAFLRCCENQLAKIARLGGPQGMQLAEAEWQAALLKAKEADSRSTAPRWVGQQTGYLQRLADMPLGDDIT